MIGLLIGAAVLGVIIAVMEGDGEFPGWPSMFACVLAATIPAVVLNSFLPPELFLVGLAVGALCAGAAISALCGMSLQRAGIAAAIYLAFQVVISLGIHAMLS